MCLSVFGLSFLGRLCVHASAPWVHTEARVSKPQSARCVCNVLIPIPQVAGRIGRGAYGGVWQATILENKTEVVVKVVFPDPDLDPEDASKARPSEEKLSSFRREIEVMSLLQHPNITAILGITSDSRVLVLEEAITDLHQMIKRQKRSLSLPAVRRWSRELLDGGNNSKVLDHACPIETVNISNFLFSRVCLVVLVACVPVLFDKYSVQYLHSIKVIHRDLKPSNLLIFKDMTLKLGDFGLAREAAPTEMLPVRREICTLWYRAPELIMGDESYCSKIDVWSAGCIMLEMLVGRCATAGRVEDVCKVHVPQTVPPTRTPQSLTHRSTPSLINTKC